MIFPYKCKYPAFSTFAMGKFCRVKSSLPPPSSMVKHPPAMKETRVQPLGPEDPLEEERATHSSILAWGIPWAEEPGRVQAMGLQSQTRGYSPWDCRVRHRWASNTESPVWTSPWISAKGLPWHGCTENSEMSNHGQQRLFWSQLKNDLPGLPGGLRWGLLPMQGVQGQFLVGERRSHMSRVQRAKI